QQRQQQLTSDVLAKINSYIQEYGKDKGFKIIFGTTTEGNILYGLDEDDLTETILTNLNSQYKSNLEESIEEK
ncbi:MAG: OmpH family outer membrane protein, partial [Chitinophagaceae bacterium]